MEMYEKQDPFKLQDFVNMSLFLNMFIYKSIIGQLFGKLYAPKTTFYDLMKIKTFNNNIFYINDRSISSRGCGRLEVRFSERFYVFHSEIK